MYQSPYLQPSPYSMQPYQAYSQPTQQQNVFPPQQIPTANGKASIDAIRMSPNSSILIADSTAPIIWKCISDSLGNVTAEPYDVLPHKDEAQVKQENTEAILANMNDRLRRLEEHYEQSLVERSTTEQSTPEPRSNQANMGNSQKYGKSSGNAGTNATK